MVLVELTSHRIPEVELDKHLEEIWGLSIRGLAPALGVVKNQDGNELIFPIELSLSDVRKRKWEGVMCHGRGRDDLIKVGFDGKKYQAHLEKDKLRRKGILIGGTDVNYMSFLGKWPIIIFQQRLIDTHTRETRDLMLAIPDKNDWGMYNFRQLQIQFAHWLAENVNLAGSRV